jgi:shikimate dehydrogenase
MNLYGLIGYPLSHSFSKKYFTEKFQTEGIVDSKYELFPIEEAGEIVDLVKNNPDLKGLNVTIPHKEKVIKYLDDIDPIAKAIGAVNVIKIENGKLKGYNSDFYGFLHSLHKFIQGNEGNIHGVFILGNGGASKSVGKVVGADNDMALQQTVKNVLKIYPLSHYRIVSRTRSSPDSFTYEDLFKEENKVLFQTYNLIINTTPLGMYPNIESCPDIPYDLLTPNHYLFDLVYNPEETLFMKKGMEIGAKTKNGLEMLHLQAEKAWEIWTT